MRICLLCDRGNMYCGGQGVYLYYLSREFQRMGHEVHVVVGPPYPDIAAGIKVHRIENLDFFEPGNNFFPAQNPFRVFTPLNLYELAAARLGMFTSMFSFSIRAYLKLRRLCAHYRFDVIHDNQTLGYGILLMRSLKVPLIATVHHPLPIDRQVDLAQAATPRRRFRRMMFYPFFMQHFVVRRMDRVIAVSKSSAQKTRETFKVPEHKVRVVYNGIDTGVFRALDGVKKKPDSLIMVGNTDDRKKGVLYLLKALQMLKGEVDVKLTIVDQGMPENCFAPGLVKSYGLDGMVSFTGRISTEELVRRYGTAQIAVTASLYEGFGFPAAEAMACGVPVIATRAGALPEVVGDGETGFMVPPGDAWSLAEAIKLLLADEDMRVRMGELGRRRVERLFTWQEAAEKTLRVYEEVL